MLINRIFTAFFLLLIISVSSPAQTDLFYYLPNDGALDTRIPTPASVIGHEIGEWHITHDKLVHYYYELARTSTKVSVERYGLTYENRPLLNVIITSEKNHKNLNQIRENHLKLTDPENSKNVDISNMPLVVRLGYSVHGNEPSGGNASLLMAYYLASSQSEKVNQLLENTVILIDPCLNPDGFQRFSTWVNQHKSKNLVGDPNNRENSEVWPNGRTNHYWFDLNRDWLLARHPESIGRLKLYHEWMPNIQTDHHEMGSNSTYFFQPGVSSRKHPLIPDANVTFASEIAKFHAHAMDDNKRLYYSDERFDDFYLGKGSTYPDFHGGVGILFEQASSRGHMRETTNGTISFSFTIKNQFLTSLSTLEAGMDMREKLLDYQRDFYTESMTEAVEETTQGYIFGGTDDGFRSAKLAEMLQLQDITVYKPTRDLKINNITFASSTSYIVPFEQPQYKMIKVLFEKRMEFTDSTFYDVSCWAMDLAFNLKLEELTVKDFSKENTEVLNKISFPAGGVDQKSTYAYAIPWDQYMAPALINQLLKKNVKLRVALEPFGPSKEVSFQRGTIVLPVGIQEMSEDRIYDMLSKYGSEYGVTVNSIQSGLTERGIDLGSPKLEALKKPSILLAVGNGVNSQEAGEIWHLLDFVHDFHVSQVEVNKLGSIPLDRYNVIILPNGNYNISYDLMKNWLKKGGTLIAFKSALRWLSKSDFSKIKIKKNMPDSISTVSYAHIQDTKNAQTIPGSIFSVQLDLTNPIAYGYQNQQMPIFRNHTLFLERAGNLQMHPIHYTDDPLLGGYISDSNLDKLSNTPAITIDSFGSGKVIGFTDNLNLRAFWYGTNKLLFNAVFFGHLIRTQ